MSWDLILKWLTVFGTWTGVMLSFLYIIRSLRDYPTKLLSKLFEYGESTITDYIEALYPFGKRENRNSKIFTAFFIILFPLIWILIFVLGNVALINHNASVVVLIYGILSLYILTIPHEKTPDQLMELLTKNKDDENVLEDVMQTCGEYKVKKSFRFAYWLWVTFVVFVLLMASHNYLYLLFRGVDKVLATSIGMIFLLMLPFSRAGYRVNRNKLNHSMSAMYLGRHNDSMEVEIRLKGRVGEPPIVGKIASIGREFGIERSDGFFEFIPITNIERIAARKKNQ